MKTNLLLALCSAAYLVTPSSAKAQEFQKRFVNIVFTEPNATMIIDTIIDPSPEAMTALLSAYNLSDENVHMIDFIPSPHGSLAPPTHPRMMVVKVETENINGDENTDVQVFEWNEQMTEEKMAEFAQMDVEMAAKMEELHKNQAEMHEHMEKVMRQEFRFESVENGDDENITIDISEENGKRVVKATRNGQVLSEEEAEALLKKEESMQMMHKADLEREMAEHARVMAIEHQNFGEPMHMEMIMNKDLKAIVITKPIQPAGTNSITSKNTKLKAFPNPASDKVNVSFENVKGDYNLTITTLEGRTVWNEKGTAKGKMNAKIDVSEFAAGTYLINLNYDGAMETQKLIVE